MSDNTMNILLCIDDFKGDYTRHCAVTILSILETNKNHKIKFYIMSSCLSDNNVKELKRIVKMYNQEIEFIIKDSLIPVEIKESVINRRNLTRGTRYRLFFSLYIKNIDRLLYVDCDVLVTKDIKDIYNMDMKGKAIAGYYDTDLTRYFSEIYFKTNNYINAGVILIDVHKFNNHKIDKRTIMEINEKYGKHIDNSDQDYLNIIFKNDIYIYGREMNYLVERPFGNKGIDEAVIYHCLAKTYVQHSLSTKKLCTLYYYYLDKTIRSECKYQKRISYLGFIYDYFYQILLCCFKNTVGIKYFKNVDNALHVMYGSTVKIMKKIKE